MLNLGICCQIKICPVFLFYLYFWHYCRNRFEFVFVVVSKTKIYMKNNDLNYFDLHKLVDPKWLSLFRISLIMMIYPNWLARWKRKKLRKQKEKLHVNLNSYSWSNRKAAHEFQGSRALIFKTFGFKPWIPSIPEWKDVEENIGKKDDV